MKGFIHIYTGEGKGKTTAAIGLCIRFAGSGGKIIFTQFLKDNKSSELNILSDLPQIKLVQAPKTFGFYARMTEKEKKEAREVYSCLLNDVLEMAGKESCQMLILDEVIAAYHYQLIDQTRLLKFLINKPQSLEIILTGRNPAKELIELADYVSEIKKVKHPYEHGIAARVGIEK